MGKSQYRQTIDSAPTVRGTGLWSCLLWSLSVLCLTGCEAFRPVKVPLDVLRYEHPGDSRPACLVVFLPGRRDHAGQYETAGFMQAVRQAGVHADMLAVEAHYGYYTRRTVVTRLREDVIVPALAQGYTQLWLVGVSMGGLGALLYVRDYPNDITGVVALAPFLGDAQVIGEIASAGGLHHWQPATMAAEDRQRTLWQWLKTHLARSQEGPRLYLGYGRQDSFAPANQLLAAQLPVTQVFTHPGGHNWQTWSQLWQAFLTTAGFPSGCQ
jgi:pimeloyl-ACP methyl ester carboxylesterase